MTTDGALTAEKVAAAAQRLKERAAAGKPAEVATPADLAALADCYGLGLNDWRGGAGKFRDVCIGTGAAYHPLMGFVGACKAAGLLCRLQQVNVPDHPDCGKVYAEVSSFWWGA